MYPQHSYRGYIQQFHLSIHLLVYLYVRSSVCLFFVAFIDLFINVLCRQFLRAYNFHNLQRIKYIFGMIDTDPKFLSALASSLPMTLRLRSQT